MARQLKLVRLDDFISDVDVVDLLLDPSGIVGTAMADLAVDGYLPTVAPIGAKSVHETITLKLWGATKDYLAGLIQDLDAKVKHVKWWIEDQGVERYQVWLRAQLEGETYPRQAQILNIQPPDKVKMYNPPEMYQNWIGDYTIGIERTPFWEDVYPYPTTTAISSLASLGGKAQLSETILGDVPARVAKLTFEHSGGSMISYGGWFGFKSTQFGDPANFVPAWSLANSYDVLTDTSVVGGVAVCTFATDATLKQRLGISVQQVAAAHPDDQRGKYTVILRAKMSDTSIARVRMGYGNSLTESVYTATFRSRQVISGTGWALYELGNISIPAGLLAAGESLSGFTIRLDAERISGAGSLSMDKLILIPTEGMIKIIVPDTNLTIQSDPVSIYQKADGSVVAYDQVIGMPQIRFLPIKSNDWGIPANDDRPYLVYCGIDDDYGTGNSIDVTYNYIPRWRTLRGSE